MILVTVTLSDWIYRSVVARSVLTLSRDYFRLRKPLERRVYEIARKHCGRQAEWKIGLETLLKKTGSTSPRRVFRRMIRDIAEEDGLPDYRLTLTAATSSWCGRGRGRSGRWGRGRCSGRSAHDAGAGAQRRGGRACARGRLAAILGRLRAAAAPEPGGGLPRLRAGPGGARLTGVPRAERSRRRGGKLYGPAPGR